MEFSYNSTRYIGQKNLSADLVDDIKKYLQEQKGLSKMTVGELQDLILAYRTPDGDRLLINQLEPIFTYVSRTGQVW